MPVVEKNSLMKYKDKAGNIYIQYPITKSGNVDGLDDMIDEAKKLGTAVAATSTDGVAYSATVPGITALTAGDSFIMIPDKLSTSRSTTLNVNNLGAKYLRVRVSGYSGTTSAAMTANWLSPNIPVRVTYEGRWWMADVVLPSAQQLYGNVQAEQVDYSNTNSGMTATDVQEAIDELAVNKTSTQVLTTDEYNALDAKDENVLYMLSDAEDEVSVHNADANAHKTLFDKKADPATVVSVTLPVSGWDSSNKQTVTVTGVLADTASQQVMVSPAASAKDAYISSGIQTESCGTNSITFSAATKPSSDILVMVSIQNLFATEDTVATPNMVFGTYEGDGEDSQFISLGFTPRVVVICRADGAFSQANLIYGGMATTDSPGKTVAIADGGFNALSSSSLYNGNNPMYSFKYVAIK